MKTATKIKRRIKAKLLVAVLLSTVQCQGLKVETQSSLVDRQPSVTKTTTKTAVNCKKEIRASFKRSVEKLKSLEPSVVSTVYVDPKTLQQARDKQKKLVKMLISQSKTKRKKVTEHVQFFKSLSKKYPKKNYFKELANWAEISEQRLMDANNS